MTHSRTCTITDPRRWIPPCCRQGLGGYCNWTGLLRSGSHYLTRFAASHVLAVGLRAIARAFGPWTPPSEQTRRPARESLLYCTYLLTSARPSAPHIRVAQAALIGPRMFPFRPQCLGIGECDIRSNRYSYVKPRIGYYNPSRSLPLSAETILFGEKLQ